MTEKVDNDYFSGKDHTGSLLAKVVTIKAIFTLYQIAFMSPWTTCWTGLLFTHNNSSGDAISVTEQSCAAPISKVEYHIS